MAGGGTAVLYRPFFFETFCGPVPVCRHFSVGSDLCGTVKLSRVLGGHEFFFVPPRDLNQKLAHVGGPAHSTMARHPDRREVEMLSEQDFWQLPKSISSG